jgi:predicted dehydrogenase
MDTDIRIGIVGAKFAGSFHAQCWAAIPGAAVTAVAARDTAARSAFASRFGIRGSYGGHRELLADPDVQVVDICAPNYLHARIAVAAMEAGKDVICEKPLATTLADARTILETQARTGRRLYYAEDWLFAPALVRAREILEEGGIGTPVCLRGRECHNGSHSPFAQTIEFCGGGAMIHLGVHPVGLFIAMLGLPRTVLGRCSGGGARNLVHHGLEGEDWGMGILTWPGGAQGIVEGNYVTTGGMEDVVEIVGTGGVLRVELSLGSPLRVYSRTGFAYAVEKADTAQGWTRPAVDENSSLGYRDEFAHFARCIRSGEQQAPGTTAADGANALRVIDAIYRSHRSGREVTLAEGETWG